MKHDLSIENVVVVHQVQLNIVLSRRVKIEMDQMDRIWIYQHQKWLPTLRRPKQVRFCTALFKNKTPRNDVGFFSELPCFFDPDFSCLLFQFKKVPFSFRCNKQGSFVLVRTMVS